MTRPETSRPRGSPVHSPSTTGAETPVPVGNGERACGLAQRAELRDYLHFNSDFPAVLLARFATHLQYRLALPWSCLVVVFIAAPLGIGFRAAEFSASVATATACLRYELSDPSFRLGRRLSMQLRRLEPPNIVFAIIGLDLLTLRAGNREVPRLRLARATARLMDPLANEWPIKHRAEACAVTQRPFAAGENFYTLLFFVVFMDSDVKI